MFYKTFICFYASEAKPLRFSLCSQIFDDAEPCLMYNIQNVCHRKSLSIFLQRSITCADRTKCESGNQAFYSCINKWLTKFLPTKNVHTSSAASQNPLTSICQDTWPQDTTIDDSAKGGLTIFWELFTVIPCAPKYLKRK